MWIVDYKTVRDYGESAPEEFFAGTTAVRVRGLETYARTMRDSSEFSFRVDSDFTAPYSAGPYMVEAGIDADRIGLRVQR